MYRFFILLLVAALGFQSSTAFSDDDVNGMKDSYLKLVTKYLVDFPNNAMAAWKSYTETVLRMSDLAESLNLFADQLTSSGMTGSCVDQIKLDYNYLKSIAIKRFQVCVDANALAEDAFNWDIDNAITDISEVDRKIKKIVTSCDWDGLNEEQCEAKKRGTFLAIRMECRSTNVMPVYKMAFQKIVEGGKKVADCISESTTDLNDQISKDVQMLYQCLKGN